MSKDTIHLFNNLSIKGLVANGSTGIAGNALLSNGSGAYWGSGAGFTGSKGDPGTFGGAAFDYTFSTATTLADPGDGVLKFNNTAFNSATTLIIHDNDDNLVSINNFLQTIDDSTSAIKGHFTVTEKANTAKFVQFSIIGNHVDAANSFQVPVAYLTGVTSMTNGLDIIITFARTGDRGDQGYTGSQGFTGSQGIIGFTGSQGVIGYTGSQGFTGSQGIIGFTGSLGYTGSQGDIGFTGSASTVIGYTGSKGDIGFTGSQGIIGFTGSASTVVGYTGSKGDIGYTGSKGDIGFTGSASTVIGYTGSKGDIGFTGSASTVVGYTGSKGDIGYTGSQGIIGFTGSASTVIGYTGSKGDIGFTGSQGIIGFTGSASTVIGYTGSKGDIGFTGSVATFLPSIDDRIIEPTALGAGRANFGFTAFNNNNASPYADYFHLRSYTDGSGGNDNLVLFNKSAIGMRIYQQTHASGTAYSSYRDAVLSDSNGVSSVSGSFRAPIFYDSNDTTYYLDPQSNPVTPTISLNINGDIRSKRLDSGSGANWDTEFFIGETSNSEVDGAFPTYITGYGLNIRKNSDGAFFGLVTYDGGTNYHSVIGWGDDAGEELQFRFNNTNQLRLTGTGSLIATTSMQAPIFYDSANTAFYVDAASTSNLLGLTVTNTITGSITGNAGTASNLTSTRSNWGGTSVLSAVVGQLAWKNYGSNHTIFDASASTSPDGGAVNNTNAQIPWAGTYPTLMGWNGANTYGLRVDSARVSDSISGFNNPATAPTASTIVYRDASGDIAAREIVLSSGLSAETPTVLTSMYPTTNQLVRTTPGAVAVAIQGAASGTWGISVTGSSGSVTGLTLNSSASPINPDNVTQNQLGYNTSVSLFGQTDGGLYSSAHSSSWIHQIYGDFRTGQIAIRGKNNGTWQAWRAVLDSTNYTSYAPTLTGSGASGTWAINVTGNAATVTNGLYTSGDQNTITGTKRFYSTNNTQINTVAAADRGLSVFQETASADAYMTFHVSGDFAAYFGLGGAENDLVYGGWSAGANRHRILHSGNYTSWAPSLTGTGASGSWGISVTGNAATVGGLTPSATAAVGNRVVVADGNGYIFNNYFNSTDNSVSSGVSAVMVKTGDNYYRSGTAASIATFISGQTMNISGSATSATTATSAITPTFAGDATNRADITTRVDSGFYEHDTVSTAEGWPYNGSWMHMIAATHSNDGNYYSMQIAGDFFSNSPFYRSVNNSGTTAWNRFALYDNAYSGELRATIFRDNDNTAYYLDPADTSFLNTVSMGAQTWRSTITWNDTVNVNISGESSFDMYTGGTFHVWDISASNYAIRANNGGQTVIGQAGTRGLSVQGALTATDNITAYSDVRIKRDIHTVENALEKTLALRGVTYYRIDDGVKEEERQRRKLGVVAQEVELILPEVVREDDEGIKSVDYGNIVGLLIEAIKEQQVHINNMQLEINSLKSDI